jgi:beta-lactam-binding protein with PASTA domain
MTVRTVAAMMAMVVLLGAGPAGAEAASVGPTVLTPNVVGLPTQQAKETLTRLGLRVRVIPDRVAAAPGQVGLVHAQEPIADSLVLAGARIVLRTYHRPAKVVGTVVVPEVRGWPAQAAVVEIRKRGLKTSVIRDAFTPDRRQAGVVAVVEPGPGTAVPLRSTVVVHVFAYR